MLNIKEGTVFIVPYFIEHEFKNLRNTLVEIDDKEYIVKGTDRNHCTGFGQYKTYDDYLNRDVWILV